MKAKLYCRVSSQTQDQSTANLLNNLLLAFANYAQSKGYNGCAHELSEITKKALAQRNLHKAALPK